MSATLTHTSPWSFLGGTEVLAKCAGAGFVVSVGSPTSRRMLASRAGDADLHEVTVVHGQATIGEDVELGAGTVICAGRRLTTIVRTGVHVHVDINATVAHDVTLDDFVTLNPQAALSGEVTDRRGSRDRRHWSSRTARSDYRQSRDDPRSRRAGERRAAWRDVGRSTRAPSLGCIHRAQGTRRRARSAEGRHCGYTLLEIPLRRRTVLTVQNRMCTSSLRDHMSTEATSRRERSSQDTAFRPDTCAKPVRPGQAASSAFRPARRCTAEGTRPAAGGDPRRTCLLAGRFTPSGTRRH